MFSVFPCFLFADDFCFCFPLVVSACCCFGVIFVCFLLEFSLFISFWFIRVCCCLVLLLDLALVDGWLGSLVLYFIICAILCCGDSFGGDGFEDVNGIFVGDCFCHSGPRFNSSIRYVRRFGVIFYCSGLSLGLLKVLLFGGLCPKLGRVVILSIFGCMYGPKVDGSVLR